MIGNYQIHQNQFIRENYSLLIPDKKDGLVIFHLYAQIKEDLIGRTFSEQKIHDTIYVVLNELGEAPQRKEIQRDTQTIQRLRKHFIEKSPTGKGYQLTEYAQNLCRIVEDEISIHFNPSEIEKILQDLLTLLQSKLNNLEEFQHWFDQFFLKHKDQLSLQIRALQMQVDETIDNLNNLIRHDTKDFLELIKTCDEQLDEVKSQADKLSQSLALKDDIQDVINQSPLIEFKEFREKKNVVKDFLNDIDAKLNNISTLFDKIKPRINKLYNDFNKREYDRKVEKFLLCLFRESTFKEKTPKIKELKSGQQYNLEITFPQWVQDKYFIDLQPRFVNIEPKYNFLEPQSALCLEPQFDHADLARQVEQRKRQIYRATRIDYWLEMIKTDLTTKNEIEFADYFYRIIEQDDDFEIAVKVANFVLKEYSMHPVFEVNVEPMFQFHPVYRNNAIWKMQIRHKKQKGI